MDENPRLFYLSGLLSFFIFFIFLFVFVRMLFFENKIRTYGLKKDKFVSISLENIPTKSKHTEKKELDKPLTKPKEVVKKATKPAVKKVKKRSVIDPASENVDVDSLFSNVWTKKIDTRKTKPKRRAESRSLAEIEKSIEVPKVSDIKRGRSSSKSGKKNAKAASTGEEVNEYSAKIHAIVYDHFYPPSNSEGEQVRAVIELSPLGKVIDFRILNYSANEALNEEVDRIKNRIKNIVFPKSPDNKRARVIIILKPEAKE